MSIQASEQPQRCTCINCAVETSWVGKAGQDALPVNWAETPNGPACLHCQRELAADAAVREPGLNLQDRARLRASTIVDFEVKRDPDRTNSQIANAIHSSVVAVQKARDRIDDAVVVA